MTPRPKSDSCESGRRSRRIAKLNMLSEGNAITLYNTEKNNAIDALVRPLSSPTLSLNISPGSPFKKPKHINLTIDCSSAEAAAGGAKKLLKVLRPLWKEDKIVMRRFQEGLSNYLVGYKLENADDASMILIRVHGEKSHIFTNHEEELRVLYRLWKAQGVGEVYARFNNGICYGFVPGKPLKTEHICSPPFWKLISRNMAELHKLNICDVGESKNARIWSLLHKCIDNMPERFQNSDWNIKYHEIFSSKQEFLSEILWLESKLRSTASPIVFCHNDLNPANVIFNEHLGKVYFIDHEFASYNPQAYDIANHFCEFAGIEEINFAKYPSRQFQFKWLETYLKYYGRKPNSELATDDDIDIKEIEKLYALVNQYALVSHLLWSAWSAVQAKHSSHGENFDFLDYAKVRMDEYRRRKSVVFEV